MNRVIYVCSPLKGDIAGNIEKARLYCKLVIKAGYIPLSTHMLFNGVLDDTNPQEREVALTAGEEMLRLCDEVWIFGDTVSDGMRREIEAASRAEIQIRLYDERQGA